MTGEKFDKIVKARANERVQEKIRQLRAAANEMVKPFGIPGYGWDGAHDIFTALARGGYSGTWPRSLWETEENLVAGELLGIMDEMQRALIAVSKEPGPDDVMPEDPAK